MLSLCKHWLFNLKPASAKYCIEGRVKQALKDDKIVKVALDILSDKLVYETSLIPFEITEN